MSAFSEGLWGKKRPDYRDPWDYFGASLDDPKDQGATWWQRCAWLGHPYTNRGTGVTVPGTVTLTTPGVKMAMVGGKGSGKSHLAAMGIAHRVQRYPGSVGFIAANTYNQAFMSAGAALTKSARALGLNFTTHSDKIVDGIKYPYVFMFHDFDSVVVIISLAEAKNYEGSEFDYGHFEEIQDAKENDVNLLDSRIRRTVGDRSRTYAGMTNEPNHWMYPFFEEAGIPLYEPVPEESDHITGGYTEELKRIYRNDPVQLDRFLRAVRQGESTQKCLPAFDWYRHVKAQPMAERSPYDPVERLSTIDPYRQIYLLWDFNVNPLCVTAWQEKKWVFRRGEKTVWAQVGEWEMFGATTGMMCDLILADLASHQGGFFISGDSTADKLDTRSPGETDWTIIKKKFALRKGVTVRPGIIKVRRPADQKRQRGTRKLEYRNPLVRDRVNALQSLLLDPEGDVGIVFLPQSQYASGGAANSCASALWGPDGRADSKNDKSADKSVPRTHFFDTVGYLAYLVQHVFRGEAERSANRPSHGEAALRARQTGSPEPQGPAYRHSSPGRFRIG